MDFREEIIKSYDEYCGNIRKLISGKPKISEKKVFTNWFGVSKEIEILKNNLCLFAVKLDKYLKNMECKKTIELSEDMREDIEDFVEEFFKMKNFFIYVFIEGEDKKLDYVKKKYTEAPYLCVIENFELPYNWFKSNFTNLKNIKNLKKLAKFFTNLEYGFFMKYNLYIRYLRSCKMKEDNDLCLCLNLNEKTLYFAKTILFFITKKLTGEKWIIGLDEKYFNEKSRLVIHKNSHEIEPVPECVKIFPTGEPLPHEVKQSKIGDCYLMAALISLAKNNPKSIKDCFIQGLDKIETEDDIDIRFFRKIGKKGDFTKSSIIITVNKNKVVDTCGIKDGALWPKLIEKAYAIYRCEGYDFMFPQPRNLKGGRSGSVMFAITGKKVRLGKIESVDRKSKFDPDSIIATIIRKLSKKMTITCSFKKNFKIKDEKSKEDIEIFTNHAYAIVGVNEKEKYIRLINPWKRGGRTIENSPKSKEGGHIAMKYKDFESQCKKISYTTRKDFPLVST